MAKQIKMINRIQPLQLDTVQLLPKSYIRGGIKAAYNVTGTALAGKLVTVRNTNVALPEGNYRVEVAIVGAVGVGAYKIHDLDHGTVSANILTSATAQAGLIAGVNLTIADTTGTVLGDYAEFQVEGDQTYIIPGTVVGRFASGVNKGKWAPAYDDTIATFDVIRVISGFAETNKDQTLAPNLRQVNISENYATSCYIFAQLIEANLVNLTANLKAKLTGIVWE